MFVYFLFSNVLSLVCFLSHVFIGNQYEIVKKPLEETAPSATSNLVTVSGVLRWGHAPLSQGVCYQHFTGDQRGGQSWA